MKVLLDHCVPRPLQQHLPGHEIRTAFQMGWAQLRNGNLLAVAEAHFGALLTSDQNLRYQQNVARRRIGIVILPTNNIRSVIALAPKILQGLSEIQSGGWIEIEAD